MSYALNCANVGSNLFRDNFKMRFPIKSLVNVDPNSSQTGAGRGRVGGGGRTYQQQSNRCLYVRFQPTRCECLQGGKGRGRRKDHKRTSFLCSK